MSPSPLGDVAHSTPAAPPTPRAPAAAPAVAPAAISGATAPLRRLNAAAPREAERLLLACCGSRHWAHRLATHRPYPTNDALLAAGDEASYDMTHSDLTEALTVESAQHPASEGPSALAAHTAMRAAHAAYEARFGYPFVVHLDDFHPEERLDQALCALRARLGHAVEEECHVAAEELRQIARGRLTRLVAGPRPGVAEP